MTSEEYEIAIKGVMDDLNQGVHADIMIQTANTAIQMIKSRIQETGMNAQGTRFRAYSEWYKKYKESQGKFKGYTDFSFTNRMWTNIQLVKSDNGSATISTRDKGTLGSRTNVPVKAHVHSGKQIPAKQKSVYIPSNYEKLEKNTESFGPILELSEEEKKNLKLDYEQSLVRIFTKNGLGL